MIKLEFQKCPFPYDHIVHFFYNVNIFFRNGSLAADVSVMLHGQKHATQKLRMT